MKTVSQCLTVDECVTYNDGYRNGYRDGQQAIESLLASERAQVIAEVREWAEECKHKVSKSGPTILVYSKLLTKLDSMEPDKGDQPE